MHPLRFSLIAFAIWAATSTTKAQPADSTTPSRIGFSMERASGGDRVRLDLRGRDHHMTSDYAPAALVGLDAAQLRAGGAPIRFALIRPAGRLDCAGAGGGARPSGACDYLPDGAFADFLVAHGIARPTAEQSLTLALTGVSRDLVQALADAHFPVPSPDDLAGMAALGIDRAYIADLAGHGYRPDRPDTLMAFKAIGVDGDYVEGLARSGYRRLSADEVVQFRALGVTPAYLGDLAAAGYPDLSAEDVSSLRAIGVTSGYIEDLSRAGYHHLPVERLIEMRALATSRIRVPARPVAAR